MKLPSLNSLMWSALLIGGGIALYHNRVIFPKDRPAPKKEG